IYPCQVRDDSGHTVVVADPVDATTHRAVELVLGISVTFAIASFEDIATALSERFGLEEPDTLERDTPPSPGNDDVESLRDLASGAPVVRAVNDLLEKAMELRATDIHIEPFRTGLVGRMRVA